jgi:eukaryotic-like serine/threonine-protein kinase
VTWLSNDAVARLREITEAPDLSGTRYRLVRELGRGGMGVVYEVEDVELDRHAALKVTNVILREPDELRVEARTIARLEHPGIVPVHDVGALADGRVYYAMKLVRGTRLDEWSRGAHTRTERLRLFARICEPVAFAHRNGVVHRDLKPANVMVGELGAVLVMDWGVAGVGTPGYMAPEQERGEATAASDVFALGRLLEGLIEGEPRPRRLSAILRRATAEDPGARYRDAGELAIDVLRFLDGEPVSAYRESFLDRVERFTSRNRVVLTLIAAYIVMRVIVFFWMRL